MHNLQKVAEECISEMRTANIPIRDDKIIEMKSEDMDGYFGICEDGGYNNYTIIIKRCLLDDLCPLKELKEIIIHELIHTCPRCFSHGKTWMKYASIMNNQGYNLCEGKDYDSIFHKEKPVMHKYICPKCNSSFNSRKKEEWNRKCSFCNSWMKKIL